MKSAPRQRRLRLACTHLRVRCRPRRVAARAKNGLRRRSSVTSFSERSLNQRIAELAGLLVTTRPEVSLKSAEALRAELRLAPGVPLRLQVVEVPLVDFSRVPDNR